MVESQTVVGTKQHGRGTVEAEVLLSDIPVQNGVVHLISKPLVIMASTLWEHLDPSKPVSGGIWEDLGGSLFVLVLSGKVSLVCQKVADNYSQAAAD